ncbi:MAG: secondary thiamine-phosphate synthase enzyme YjbQ [Patescibacteria group bacterium]|nr:secondary thiamine-phosphate synthase enzyme YjbQ [Patescibacteria group bacterium]
MKITNTTISLETKETLDIIDITEEMKKIVEKSKIENGFVNIQSMHTTATVFVNENEPELFKDFKNHLKNLAAENDKYYHDDFDVRTVNMCEDECKNGHAHCKAIHLPTSVCLNLISNKLRLGTWQRILFIELDHARKRKIEIQIIGE